MILSLSILDKNVIPGANINYWESCHFLSSFLEDPHTKFQEELNKMLECDEGVQADVETIIKEAWTEVKAESEEKNTALRSQFDKLNSKFFNSCHLLLVSNRCCF